MSTQTANLDTELPRTDSDSDSDSDKAPSTGVKPAASRSKAKRVLPALLAVALLGGGARWAVAHGHESTDDAQVEGRIANVSPRISGQVAKVLVADNQAVKAGDVLVELDPTDSRRSWRWRARTCSARRRRPPAPRRSSRSPRPMPAPTCARRAAAWCRPPAASARR
ncbi:biotin/lipoyl-binding protein, partial [Pyxidicoccus sp. 3LFB2]